jgi:hypothetical protein
MATTPITAEELAADFKARDLPIELVLDAARLLLFELPYDEAAAQIMRWMAGNASADTMAQIGELELNSPPAPGAPA